MKFIKHFFIESCYYWLGAEIYRRKVNSTSEKAYFDPKPIWDWDTWDYSPSWDYLSNDDSFPS